jgi:hypothetical protein
VLPSSNLCNRFIGEETFASGAKTEFTHLPTWIVDPIGNIYIYSIMNQQAYKNHIYRWYHQFHSWLSICRRFHRTHNQQNPHSRCRV